MSCKNDCSLTAYLITVMNSDWLMRKPGLQVITGDPKILPSKGIVYKLIRDPSKKIEIGYSMHERSSITTPKSKKSSNKTYNTS